MRNSNIRVPKLGLDRTIREIGLFHSATEIINMIQVVNTKDEKREKEKNQ